MKKIKFYFIVAPKGRTPYFKREKEDFLNKKEKNKITKNGKKQK